MTPDAACTIINQLIFRPGWHFHAQPWGSEVIMGGTIDTQDTNHPPRYQQPITIGIPEMVFDPAGMNDDDLMYAILKHIEYINNHEDREFLRRGDKTDAEGRPQAPFHPHHPVADMTYRTLDYYDQRKAA